MRKKKQHPTLYPNINRTKLRNQLSDRKDFYSICDHNCGRRRMCMLRQHNMLSQGVIDRISRKKDRLGEAGLWSAAVVALLFWLGECVGRYYRIDLELREGHRSLLPPKV